MFGSSFPDEDVELVRDHWVGSLLAHEPTSCCCRRLNSKVEGVAMPLGFTGIFLSCFTKEAGTVMSV